MGRERVRGGGEGVRRQMKLRFGGNICLWD